ncbi:TPA: hypothetical protein ACHKO7_001721, partial [Campylobacter jejuni]
LFFLIHIGDFEKCCHIIKNNYWRLDSKILKVDSYEVIFNKITHNGPMETLTEKIIFLIYNKNILDALNMIRDNLDNIDKFDFDICIMYLFYTCLKIGYYDLFFIECSRFLLDRQNYLSLSFMISNIIDNYYALIQNSEKSIELRINIASILSNIKFFEKGEGVNLYFYKNNYAINLPSFEDKPKIAVCLWGIFRGNYIKALDDINKLIVKPLNADLFIHTWNECHIWSGYGGDSHFARRFFDFDVYNNNFPISFREYENLKEYFPTVLNKIKEPIIESLPIQWIKEHYSVLDMECEKFNDFQEYQNENLFLKFKPYQHYHPYAISKLRYQMYKSVSLAKRYEVSCGCRYDYIIVCRLDTPPILELPLDFLKSIGSNELSISFDHLRIDDRLFAGKRDTVVKFVDKWCATLKRQSVDFYDIFSKLGQYGDELFEYFWMVECKIIPTPIPNQIDFLRVQRGMFPFFLNELLIDLDGDGKKFKCDESYKRFVEFIICNKEKYFKNYNSNFKVGAANRVKNQLAYRLGRIMVLNSKNFFDFIKTPIKLLYEVFLYKKEQKEYKIKIMKNPELKLPPLSEYLDYNEVDNIKRHLSYRLGNALIEANK